MSNSATMIRTACISLFASAALLGAGPGAAATGAQIESGAKASLTKLYQESPTAKALGQGAKGVLVFPEVVKAGLVVGGQSGKGVLLKQGKRVGFYQSSAVSAGLQAGVQSYSFAVFFMSDKVMQEFESSKGFEIGVGPNVVVVDAGAAKDINTLTAKSDVYAFVFGQKGLMAGIGLQGTKISQIEP
jgi:lipid-binding SYLF domain-containing protein